MKKVMKRIASLFILLSAVPAFSLISNSKVEFVSMEGPELGENTPPEYNYYRFTGEIKRTLSEEEMEKLFMKPAPHNFAVSDLDGMCRLTINDQRRSIKKINVFPLGGIKIDNRDNVYTLKGKVEAYFRGKPGEKIYLNEGSADEKVFTLPDAIRLLGGLIEADIGNNAVVLANGLCGTPVRFTLYMHGRMLPGSHPLYDYIYFTYKKTPGKMEKDGSDDPAAKEFLAMNNLPVSNAFQVAVLESVNAELKVTSEGPEQIRYPFKKPSHSTGAGRIYYIFMMPGSACNITVIARLTWGRCKGGDSPISQYPISLSPLSKEEMQRKFNPQFKIESYSEPPIIFNTGSGEDFSIGALYDRYRDSNESFFIQTGAPDGNEIGAVYPNFLLSEVDNKVYFVQSVISNRENYRKGWEPVYYTREPESGNLFAGSYCVKDYTYSKRITPYATCISNTGQIVNLKMPVVKNSKSKIKAL